MSDIEPGQMCEYCGNNPAIEWSDQGRAQCEVCSPNTDTDQPRTDGGVDQSGGDTERQSLDARPDVEEYYPHYVIAEEVEFDHCYYECRCGWRSRDLRHPSMAEHHRDGHGNFGQTVECGLGKCVLVFEDGSVAEVAV